MKNEKILKRIDSNANELGYDFKNYKKIQKHYKNLKTPWKEDVDLGPLEGGVLTLYVKHPRIKDLVEFDEDKIISFIAENANVQLVKIKPVIYIDNHLSG